MPIRDVLIVVSLMRMPYAYLCSRGVEKQERALDLGPFAQQLVQLDVQRALLGNGFMQDSIDVRKVRESVYQA